MIHKGRKEGDGVIAPLAAKLKGGASVTTPKNMATGGRVLGDFKLKFLSSLNQGRGLRTGIQTKRSFKFNLQYL